MQIQESKVFRISQGVVLGLLIIAMALELTIFEDIVKPYVLTILGILATMYAVDIVTFDKDKSRRRAAYS